MNSNFVFQSAEIINLTRYIHSTLLNLKNTQMFYIYDKVAH